jgi:NhaP-type Na+/H+ or K+/H+ antiporter
LIGIAIHIDQLLADWAAIGWAILAVLAARAVSIHGFSLLGAQIRTKWKHVLCWGGVGGAIVLALALSLFTHGVLAPQRAQVQAMAFGVVLFTLLIQGFSMDTLMKPPRIVHRPFAQEEYDRRHARFVMA